MESPIYPLALGALPVAYTPYGYSRNDDATVQGFTGQLRIFFPHAYLLGNGVRIFSTILMRFYSPDFSYSPFGAGDINSYGYCGADPVNYSDPSGFMLRPRRSSASLITPPSTRPASPISSNKPSRPRSPSPHINDIFSTPDYVQVPHQSTSPNTSRTETPRPVSSPRTADTRPVVQPSHPAPQPNAGPQSYARTSPGNRSVDPISAATASAIFEVIDNNDQPWKQLTLEKTNEIRREMVTARQAGRSASLTYIKHELTPRQRGIASSWFNKIVSIKRQQ
ncbi:RHS repeat-associated core domain-containing protein [Pseudomonas farsensis]|uniref:RHS repeat-associated core domain-containing protein n=1 Tax=Pseudomonas farsensis TaxID=2745492 RepID=A0ABU8QML0_9PSED